MSGPPPGASVGRLLRSDQLARSYYMGLFQLPVLPERLMLARPELLDRVLAGTGMPPDAIARVHSEIVDSGALTGSLNWYRALLLAGPRALSAPVRVPVTHVWSSADTALTRRGAELTERYVTGDYRLEVIEGASHWLPEERPHELAEIIVERIESVPK
ncbi:hypothetical protein [Nocardia sp. NPDC058497]|uniref:hypothetical protein n=1 Tax=Nocardia sp. NPDC058497 TaxID=3346529 RepID=UPI00365698D9